MKSLNIDKLNLFYDEPIIKTPFKKIKITFADDTATGRPLPIINKLMEKYVLPYYSNTHSNAYCGQKMHKMILKTKKYIRKYYNLSKDHVILFTGNGVTGAVNHLVGSINVKKYKKINIYLSKMEHYSNYLPWIELSKSTNNVFVNIIPFDEHEENNLMWLENQLNDNKNNDILNIITIIGCSNVTGIITNLDIYKQFKNNYKNVFLFVDSASLVPHIRINAHDIDALFISGHKFLGGTNCPGILIANKILFSCDKPYETGGGCVKEGNEKIIIYDDNIEKKESAGTPNICGIIQFLFVLKINKIFINTIQEKDKQISKYIYDSFRNINDEDLIIIFGNKNSNRIPIISIYHKKIQYQFIVTLLNDLFGIQTRGGISCAGLFGEYMKNKYNIDGWCRITFSWYMNQQTIEYIIESIKYIIKHANKYLHLYKYDNKTGLFIFCGNAPDHKQYNSY